MLPVHWDGQWPIITNSNEEVKYVNKNPYLPAQAKTLSPMNGNFKVRDDFNSETLSYTWNLIRTPRDTWYSLKEKPGSLIIRPRPVAIYSNGNPSFIGRRQQHTNFSASASMQFNPLSSKNTAGMVAFQNEKFYLFLGVKKVDNSAQIFVESSGSNLNNGKPTIIANAPLAQTQNVYLKIDGKGRYYSFYYATKQDQWVLLKENVDASILSTKIAGGFVGTYIGMYAFNEE